MKYPTTWRPNQRPKPPTSVRKFVEDEIARGAAPAIATNQTLRELMAAEMDESLTWALTQTERREIESLILNKYGYGLNSFKPFKPEHMRAAAAFIRLLRETIGDDLLGSNVKLVPTEHVSEGMSPGRVAIIYEECAEFAEGLQGCSSGSMESVLAEKGFPKFEAMMKDHGVYFEMINHWSTAVLSR